VYNKTQKNIASVLRSAERDLVYCNRVADKNKPLIPIKNVLLRYEWHSFHLALKTASRLSLQAKLHFY